MDPRLSPFSLQKSCPVLFIFFLFLFTIIIFFFFFFTHPSPTPFELGIFDVFTRPVSWFVFSSRNNVEPVLGPSESPGLPLGN